MANDKPTLTEGYKANEPYAWIARSDGPGLTQEWLDNFQAPEKHSYEIVGSYDPAGLDRAGIYMGPIFGDPEYGALTLAERELIGVVVSAFNSCPTCLIIHTHVLGTLIGDHGRARRISVNYRAVELSAEERAIADFAIKLTERPGRMEAADVQALRDVGISDRKIHYIIEMAAVFNLTNRLTAGAGLRPDEEFMQAIAPPPPPPEG